MLTIRTTEYQDELIAFLRINKIRFTPRIKKAIQEELEQICSDFKKREKRIKNAPNWLYD